MELPQGPCWYRYNHDGYGEQEDGRPFNVTGIGRAWPLLAGERAHYELAAGRRAEAEKLLAAMEAFAADSGLLPEQVWDKEDRPEHELYQGRPTGSAMPLVWAHSEYIKLRRSLKDGKVFDMPPQTVRRYITGKKETPFAGWRFNHKIESMPAGKKLRIEVLTPALVRWSIDGWENSHDLATRTPGFDIHVADLATEGLASGARVSFTFYWPGSGAAGGEFRGCGGVSRRLVPRSNATRRWSRDANHFHGRRQRRLSFRPHPGRWAAVPFSQSKRFHPIELLAGPLLRPR